MRRGLQRLSVGYVMALKPSHTWWHPKARCWFSQRGGKRGRMGEYSVSQAAWRAITRTFRNGDQQQWWVLEIVAGPYGPGQVERAVIATTDPLALPDLTTWYLVANLPAFVLEQGQSQPLSANSLEEVVRLYGLRQWIEHSYKQVKHVLGWAQYQVRSDQAIRRHWQLVCCAFSFCWYHANHSSASTTDALLKPTESDDFRETDVPAKAAGTGEKINGTKGSAATGVLASGTADGAGLVGTLDPAVALLESVEQAAPASCSPTPA